MDWSGRSLIYAYGALGLAIVALVVAQSVGGSRGLGWAGLSLAAVIIVVGLRSVVRARRRHQAPSWSPVLFGALFACLSLKRVASERWEPTLMSLALAFVLAEGIAYWRESRREKARFKHLEKDLADGRQGKSS